MSTTAPGSAPVPVPTGRRVLVTGGAGFVGSHLVERLVAAGNDVTVLDNLSTGSWDNLRSFDPDATRVRRLEGSVLDHDAVHAAVRGQDVVYHLAILNLRLSLGDPWSNANVNGLGALAVALACSEHGVDRMVYVSSSEVYGHMPEAGSLPRPRTVYASSKLAGEFHVAAVCRSQGLRATIVRPFNAYGPRCHLKGAAAEVLPRFALRLRAGWPLPVFGAGDQTRVFTYVSELAEGIARAGALTSAGVAGPYDLAYPRPVSVLEVATALAHRITGEPPRLEPYPARPGDVQNHHADPGPARDALGFEATVRLEDGLTPFLEWLDAEVPDPSTILGAAPGDERNWTRPA